VQPSNEATRARAPRTRQQENSRRIALLAAQAGLEKKAEAVEIIDVTGKVDYADYIVLMTGTSDRNVAAIADAIAGDLARQGIRAIASEGLPLASWVLIDFVDVVVHVFQRDSRSIYNLDGLWMDAGRVAPSEYASDFVERRSSSS
jgi:ribosome-associated protein